MAKYTVREVVTEEREVEFQVGDQFHTGNEHINQMEPGTVLLVHEEGKFEIIELPAEEIIPGDRINTKYGPATAVRLSSRPLDRGVIYVADKDPVVRSAYPTKVSRYDEPGW